MLVSLAALLLTALFALPLAGQTVASRKATPARDVARFQGSASPDWPGGQLVYENGPINGTNTAWVINNGFIVGDSFTVANAFAPITELSFGAWLDPGTTLQSVEVSLTSTAFGGTIYFDEMVGFAQIGCTANEQGFNVCLVSGTFPGVALNAGTYWVNLQNATTSPAGQPVYWDENSGAGCQSGGCPSQAAEQDVGTIPSEAFTLSGGSAIATTTSLSAPGSATAGQVVTLAATVQAQTFPVEIGSVTFLSGKQVLGTVQVTSSTPGTAKLLTRFGPGSYSLTAQYNGNEFLLGSTSTAQPLTVTGTEPTTSTLAATPSGSNYNFTQNVLGTGNAPLAGTGSLQNVTQGGLVIGSIPIPGPGTSTFPTAKSYAANVGPQGIAVGDFNGDGIPDLAITNNSGTTVSVLLGNADGGFQSPTQSDVGTAPVGIVAWDFNGDGILDLAVANSQGVSILLGKGNGTFQPQNLISLGAGTSPWALAVGDFNGDGNADLAITDANNGVVRLLLGTGNGTFNFEAVAPEVGTDPEGIAVGDFNHDGVPDLAVTNFGSASGTNGLSILIGVGDGTFRPQETYTTGKVPLGVAVGDFRGNGNIDLAVANLNDNTITVFLNDGKGVFEAQVPVATGSLPFGVVVTDFNGDGNLDLAVSNSDDPPNSTVTVLLGNGEGAFEAQPNYTVGANPNGLVVADFNGDGAPDIATANNGGNTASVLLTQTTSLGTLNNVTVYGNGPQTIDSVFTPDGTFYGGDTSNTVAVQGIGLAPTNTTLSGTPDPSTYLETVVFTAVVTSVAGSPTGTVTFADGAGPIPGCSNVALVPGSGGSTATCSTTTIPLGSNCITAGYTGGGIFAGSQTPCFTQTVNQAATATTVTANPPSPSTYGEQVTFTATVTGANGGSPTGSVTFTADGNVICPGVTLVPGTNGSTASCPISTLVRGSHSIVASYNGSDQFPPSQSPPLTQEVNRAATTTSITSKPNPSIYLQTVTITATVIGANGGSPTQTVSFTDNGNPIPGCSAVALTPQKNGSVATCQTTTLSVGTHAQIVATYSGDNNYNGSSGTLRPAQVVQGVSTTTVIKSSQNPSVSMQPVTFTATVTTASGAPAQGQVTFQSNGVNIPDCTNPATLADGIASCTTRSLAVGSDTILASFNDPQGRYGTSSATLTQTVTGTGDFTIAPVSPDTATITQSFTNLSDPFFPHAIDLSVQPLNGYNNTVKLSCSVSPPLTGGMCSVNSPASGVVDGNLNTTLTITTASVTPVGIYTVTVTGQDNSGLIHTATLTLSVINFTTGVSMPPGGGGTTTIIFPGTAGTPIGSFTCSLVNGTGLSGDQPLSSIGGNCVFSPPSGVIPGPVQLTISGCEIARLRTRLPIYASFLFGMPGIVLLGSLAGGRRRRKSLISIVGILLVACAMLLGVGCGGYGPLTPTGNYLVLVQGTSPAGAVVSAVVPVTVKPLN
jgi:hypothetical protein